MTNELFTGQMALCDQEFYSHFSDEFYCISAFTQGILVTKCSLRFDQNLESISRLGLLLKLKCCKGLISVLIIELLHCAYGSYEFIVY